MKTEPTTHAFRFSEGGALAFRQRRLLRMRIFDQMHQRRVGTHKLGLQVNLHRAEDVEALAAALRRVPFTGPCPVECVRVADSYFMTCLGRPSTRLSTAEEQSRGLASMVEIVAEVRAALNRSFEPHERPYLVGDIPDRAAGSPRAWLEAAERLAQAGADVVKVEVGADAMLAGLELLSRRGMVTMAHLGYTPRSATIRRYGDSVAEAFTLFSLARRARDAGASSLLLEMVSEVVNRALCLNRRAAIPVYSISSGRAPFGGQSLCLGDAVFVANQEEKASLKNVELRTKEPSPFAMEDVVADHLRRLLDMALEGTFPLSPPAKTSDADLAVIASADPWASGAMRLVG